jgi:hypothetical protein
MMPAPASFLPSQCGFGFTNTWPSQPAVVLATPFGQLSFGDASGGLCGGMVFAALDYWHAGIAPPADQPTQDRPLYSYIVRRLIDSWHLPLGVTQYYQWMNLPDGDTGFNAFGHRVVIERGLAWRTITVQWPQIRADLDRGIPVALGIVTVASAKPQDLSRNHQVLAFGYEVTDRTCTVRVYDPNQAQRDDISITFDATAPTAATTFDHNLGIAEPVRGFFRTAYTSAAPPA